MPALGTGGCCSGVRCDSAGQHLDSAENWKPLFRFDCWADLAGGSCIQHLRAALSDLVQGRDPARGPDRTRGWQSIVTTSQDRTGRLANLLRVSRHFTNNGPAPLATGAEGYLAATSA